jgi:hypothetical protein
MEAVAAVSGVLEFDFLHYIEETRNAGMVCYINITSVCINMYVNVVFMQVLKCSRVFHDVV